ncbi:hypothetical protein [Hymenobacter agri]
MPLQHVAQLHEDAFKTHEAASGIKLLQLTSKEINVPGVNLIRVDKTANGGEGEAFLSITSKTLGRRYPEFLNINTLQTAIEKVNRLDMIHLDSLDSANATLLHPGRDISMPTTGQRFLQVMKLLHVNTFYRIQDFRNDNSLTFDKDVKTRKCKEYSKIYLKDSEFELSKNQNFRDSLTASDLAEMRLYFRGEVRFETEQKSMTKIRQCYNTTRLCEILASEVNPLSRMLTKLTKDMATHTELMEERLFLMSLTEKEAQVFGVCIAFEHSIEQIKHFYYTRYPRRPPTARLKLTVAKQLVSRYRAQQGKLGESDFALIKEFSERVALDI